MLHFEGMPVAVPCEKSDATPLPPLPEGGGPDPDASKLGTFVSISSRSSGKH